MDVLKNLVPGQVVMYGDQEVIFVGILPGVGYLFDNGLTIVEIGSIGISVTKQFETLFAVSERTMETLLKCDLQLSNFLMIKPGQVLLHVNKERLAKVRKVAEVDSDSQFAYDQDGDIISPWSGVLLNTQVMVPLEGLLTEKGRYNMMMLFQDC
mgnify:CR=1 FL=1